MPKTKNARFLVCLVALVSHFHTVPPPTIPHHLHLAFSVGISQFLEITSFPREKHFRPMSLPDYTGSVLTHRRVKLFLLRMSVGVPDYSLRLRRGECLKHYLPAFSLQRGEGEKN